MNGARYHGGSNKHLYIVYECSNRKRKKNDCGKKDVNRDTVEKTVIVTLEEKLFSDDAIEQLIEYMHNLSAELEETIPNDIKKYESELSGISKQIDNIVSAIANGMFHASMKDKMDMLEIQKQNISIRIDEAKRQLNAIAIPDKKAVREYMKPYQNLHEKSPEQKRSAIEAFVKKVIVYDDHVGIEIDSTNLSGAEPYCFVITSNFIRCA